MLVLHAEDGKHAKFLSNSIMCTENWDDSQQGYELMKDIARAKFQQVKKARDELYVCWFEGDYIVEADKIPNTFMSPC